MIGVNGHPDREARARREELLERFEAAFLQAGRRPALEDHLPADPTERLEVLIELVHTELELRLKAGEAARAEDYLRRFPELATLPEVEWGLLVVEYTQRSRREPGLAVGEYLHRFPHRQADLLRWRPPGALSQPVARIQTVPYTVPSPNAELIPPLPAAMPLPSIPGYEVLGELGRGGMGVVYQVRQIKLKRLAALKMVRAGSQAGRQELARFAAEAEAVARLQHPNIVQVYEVGEAAGLPYFSMEYVEGGSLADQLDGTPWLALPAALLVEVVAQAMHAAHRRGIVHRDLKPANVLLARTDLPQGLLLGGDGPAKVYYEPKITDFGLAKRLDEGGQTQSGAVMGTPSYMAPEQAGGKVRQIGAAADVYALGAILYELVTGRPPFKAANAFDTVFQVIWEEPVPPSRLQPKLPRDLETICLKCLEKDPARRYAGAEALAEELQRFREGKPIQARLAGRLERTLKWVRRQPFQAASVGATCLLFLAVLVAVAMYGLYKSGEADSYRKENEKLMQLEQARSQTDQAMGLAEKHEKEGHWAEANTELEKAQATLDAQPDLRADHRYADVQKRLAAVRQQLREQQQGQQVVTRERSFLAAHDDAVFHETLFTALDPDSNWAQTQAAARRALAVYGLDHELGPSGLASLLEQDRAILGPERYARLAVACYELLLIWAEAEAAPLPGQTEDKEQRRQRAQQALALLERAGQWGKAHDLDTRTFHLRKARYLAWARGEKFNPVLAGREAPPKPTGALDWFLAALEHYRAGQLDQAGVACNEVLKQEDHFWARYVQALCQLRAGRWVEARAALTVLALRRKEFVWPRLLRGFAASELGFRHQEHKEGELAAAEFEAAEADFDWALRQDRNPLVHYVGLANRGVLHVRRQRFQEAVRDLSEATRVKPEGFQAYLNLSQALQGLQRWDEALAALDQAVKRAPGLGVLYENRARLHLLRKDRAAARADFEQAIALEPKGSKSDRLVNDLVELGRLLHRERKYQEALARYDRSLRLQPDFALAQRFRAETLLALKRPAEASQALDRYLEATPQPPAEVYEARGLIHAGVGELAAAIDLYTLALKQSPAETAIRRLRGWLYLQTDAVPLALRDFEECLRLDPASGDALAGRGTARVRLWRLTGPVTDPDLRQKLLAGAVADAEAAVQRGPATDRLLYNVACIYAQAVAQLNAEARTGRDRLAGQRASLFEGKALNYLSQALEMMPEERRAVFWRDQIETDPVFSAVRRGTAYFQLAKRYGQSGSRP